MIKNLELIDGVSVSCEAQVCIIGAGTAGIYLAKRLRSLGLQVVILEAGDAFACRPDEIDQRCVQRGIRYRGADTGRSFGLGGTSALWGGQMIPLTRSDFDARPEMGFGGWPIPYSELEKYLPVVAQQFGLVAGMDDGTGTGSLRRNFPELYGLNSGFSLRFSQWLPFKKRNFAIAFADTLKCDDDLTVWVNAAVVSMVRSVPGCDGRIDSIAAQSPNGHQLHIKPSVVVICGGALESTRLLLGFDEDTGGAITAAGAPLGQYFADHLSVTCGRFVCRDWRRYNLAVAPIFDRNLMRSPRLELSERAQRLQRLTSAFSHFVFVTHGDTGFDVVRNFLRRRQGERLSLCFSPSLVGRVISDVSAMALWRVLCKRLWIPRQADLLLQVDIEQTPNPESRLYLSDERDAMGRKRLVIDWRITQEDVRVIRKVAELTVDAWQKSPLSEVAELELTLPDKFDTFSTQYDVYHPTGSIRMGTSASNSVVDGDLRLWAAENCYVSSTAVFPAAGSANPGMTHLALTARLADHIGKRFRRVGRRVQ
jgi:choline dehydrogenase-like flavoprotein